MPEGHDFRTTEMSHEAPEDSGATKEMDKKMEKRTNMMILLVPVERSTAQCCKRRRPIVGAKAGAEDVVGADGCNKESGQWSPALGTPPRRRKC